jgi:type IV secretory pathway TrbF-like protein
VSPAATVADVPPKTLENARRQFVEVYGSAIVMNTYLKVVLVLALLIALGLLALNFRTAARAANLKPLVIRIDAVGRAQAVTYDATSYTPQPPELRYFLTRFVVLHFSRLRATIRRDYPDSLFFLDPALADATIAQDERARILKVFLTNPSGDEIDVEVKNVTFCRDHTTALQGIGRLREAVRRARHAAGTEARNARRAD